jgi:hypothetical protein
VKIAVLNYTLMITSSIREAKKHGAITQYEADYLCAMAEKSFPASSTTALLREKGAPDFLYAALHFSTMIWQSGEAADRYAAAQAGYKLAQFMLLVESPSHDSYWAAKLLRELYVAHEESTQDVVPYVA